MRRLLFVIAAAALVAAALPVQAESIHARNVAYFWSQVGDADPLQPASMHDGRVLTLAEAIEEAAARAGPVDLAGLASGAAELPEGTYVGDIWVYSYGPGGCMASVIAGTPVPFTPVDPQLWLYGGASGSMSGNGAYVLHVYAWTMKETFSGSGHWEALGQSDFYCFSFGGMHFAFPFIDGIVQVS